MSGLIDGKSNISYQDIYMQKAIVLTLTLALASLLLLSQEGVEKTSSEVFDEWRNTHGLMLDLSPQDLQYRLRIFEQNVKAIEEHNANPAHSYKQGVNQFSAYTQQEFEAMFLSHFGAHPTTGISEAAAPIVGLNVDWVSYGAVSPVKNQGSCTASYAFSAIGGIEGISVIFYKQQQEYSVQQLIDCSGSFGNAGCAIGNMVNSYNYIAAKGIQTEVSYPYTGVASSCKVALGLFKIKGSINVNRCSDMESALLARPIPVAVDGQNFKSYTSGIFDNCQKNLSLAVLLVGATDQYYRIKLSWGVSFGEAGYMRLFRTGNSTCGICEAGTYPVPT